MGEGNAGRGGAALRGGDAGHDGPRNAGGVERRDLLAATAEDERIAAFQPHHMLRFGAEMDKQVIDLFLPERMAARGLADGNARGAFGRDSEDRLRDETVVNNHVGLGQRLHGFQGEQFRIAGTGADKRHMTLLHVSLRR
jgi:hypothetical protein